MAHVNMMEYRGYRLVSCMADRRRGRGLFDVILISPEGKGIKFLIVLLCHTGRADHLAWLIRNKIDRLVNDCAAD